MKKLFYSSKKLINKTEVDGKVYHTYSRVSVLTVCIGFASSYAIFLLLKFFDQNVLAVIPVTISMITVFAMAHSWYLNSSLIAANTHLRVKRDIELHRLQQELLETEYHIRHKMLLREMENEDKNIVQ